MTDIPQPYPGDVLPARRDAAPASVGNRARLYREYRDALGGPLAGTVHLRDSDDRSFPVDVTDGVLNLELLRGSYRLVAALHDAGGHYYYSSETVTV
jgi:hypothetical protein